jgi:uridylate kinase
VNKNKPAYQRIILKISGESFSSSENLKLICRQIIDAHKFGTEIGVVVGGGNLIRGKTAAGIERRIADRIGLLSTIVNGLLLEDALKKSAKVVHLAAFPIQGIVEPYSQEQALESLKLNRILVLSGGTGSLFFSTDTAAALRGGELEADAVIKGTKVDGVYSADPQKKQNAVKYDKITFTHALNQELKIMDNTAFALCQENRIPIIVINIFQPNSLKKVLLGKKIGSVIC